MTIASPHRYNATQIPAATFFLWGNRVADQLSTMPVIRDSTLQNSVSMPRTWILIQL